MAAVTKLIPGRSAVQRPGLRPAVPRAARLTARAASAEHPNKRVGKRELVQAVTEAANNKAGPRTVHVTPAMTERMLDSMLEVMRKHLSDGRSVGLHEFGSFEVHDRAERKVRSIRSGEEMTVPAGKRVAFRPSMRLKHDVMLDSEATAADGAAGSGSTPDDEGRRLLSQHQQQASPVMAAASDDTLGHHQEYQGGRHGE